MVSVGATLLVVTGAILVAGALLGPSSRLERGRAGEVMLAILLALAIVSVYGGKVAQTFGPDAPYLRTWNIYHYYLGAKYFPELRYTDLYACSLEADSEKDASRRIWSDNTRVRDLTNYELSQPDRLPPCPRERFTSERWASFSGDLSELMKLEPASFWWRVITDKGFNPTPFWISVGGPIAGRLAIIDDPAAMRALTGIDLVMLLASFAGLAFAFGARATLLAGLGLVTYFGSYGLLVGNFLQYGWLAFVLAAVSLWHGKRDLWAAPCFAAAIMLRVFPAMLLAGLVVRTGYVAFVALRERGSGRASSAEAEARRNLTFLTSVGGFCLLFFLVSSVTVGLEAWLDFFHNMRIHSAYVVGEAFNVGLKNLFATAGAGNVDAGFTYAQTYVATAQRLRAYADLRVYYYLAVAVLGVLFAIASVRTEAGKSFASSLFAAYLLLALSPYYYACLILVFLLPGRDRRVLGAQVGSLLLLAYHLWKPHVPYITMAYGSHMQSEVVVSAYLAALVFVLCGRSDSSAV